MDTFALFHSLINQPVYLLSLLPERTEGGRGQFSAVESFFRAGEEGIRFRRKLTRIFLTLNCAYDLEVYHARHGTPSALPGTPEHWDRNPPPEVLARCVAACGEETPRSFLNLVLNDREAMIVLDGDDLFAAVYGPDNVLQDRLRRLAASEGLFFRVAPEYEGALEYEATRWEEPEDAGPEENAAPEETGPEDTSIPSSKSGGEPVRKPEKTGPAGRSHPDRAERGT